MAQVTLLGLSPDQWNIVTAATNVALTLALVWFARRQWQVTARQADLQAEAERKRQAEAQRASDHAQDLAYRIIFAEWFRIQSVARRWKKRGLLVLASSGTLRPEDLLPRDWGLLMEQLGRLGRESAHIGGVGLTVAFDAAQEATVITQAFAKLREMPNYVAVTAVDAISSGTTQSAAGLLRTEAAVLQGAEQAGLALQEALRLSSRSASETEFAVPEDPVSDIGRWLKAQAGRSGALGDETPSRP